MNKVSPIAIDMAINMLIKPLEGCKLMPYLCPAKIPSIGYGSCYYENGSKVSMIDRAITLDEATRLCETFIYTQIVPTLDMMLVSLTDVENAALISMVYNIGVGRFKSSSLYQLLNSGLPFASADVKQAMLAYNKATIDGELVEVRGLTNRRKWEYAIATMQIAINENCASLCDYWAA